MVIGDKLKELREAKKLSQGDVDSACSEMTRQFRQKIS